jgi:hypothetical protein
MRKLIALAVVCTTALVFAAVAYAANVYKVTPASTKGAGGAGTASKPVAKKVNFGFTAKDSTGGRATPIKKYSIGFQGLKYFGKAKVFPKCSFAKVNQKLESDVEDDCGKAFVGKGLVNNRFGAASDINAPGTCALRLRLYNTGSGFALRLDGGNTAKPPTACPIPVGQAINAKFAKQRIGGKSSVALKFTVPDNLTKPLDPPGDTNDVHNSVSQVKSSITGKKRKVKVKGVTRRVSILSSVACGKKRTISVTFTDLKNDSVPSKSTTKC